MAIHRIYIDGTWYLLPIPEKADTLEATGATNDNKFMTPKKTKELIDSLDLGAISEVVTTGTGNAVTNITVSSDGKTLTATKGSTFSLSTHAHGNITNDGKIGTTANRVIVTGLNGTLIAKPAGNPGQFLSSDGSWATPTVDTTQNYTWTGSHSFRNSISLTPNTATYYLAAPETGSGTVNLPFNKTGTIALTSDLTWDNITSKPDVVDTTSNQTIDGVKTFAKKITINYQTAEQIELMASSGKVVLRTSSGQLMMMNNGDSSWGAVLSNNNLGYYTKTVFGKSLVGTGNIEIEADDVPTLPYTKISGLGSLATKNLSSDFNWFGEHVFQQQITLVGDLAGAAPKYPSIKANIYTPEGTYAMEWLMPNNNGTLATLDSIPGVVYGYCGSSASTTDKVVSSNTFTSHKVGQIYVIEFANGNTATSPTININSTGAVGVRRLTTNGAVTTSPGTYIMYARSRTIWTFVYNGAYLIPIGKSTRYWNALETKMLGYSKGSSGSAITTSDTVSSAIGKLEYRLDNSSGGGLELLRDRVHGTNLTNVGSGTSSGYVVLDKSISPGDTLMIEVSKYNNGTYNPKIVTVTVGTSSSIATTTDADYLNSWSYFNGTNMGIYTFTCWAGGSSSSSLYFGAKRYIQGSFSGTTINWTTSTYTLYVGRVWRVNR